MIRSTATTRPRWTGFLLLFALVGSSLGSAAWADPVGPTPMDRTVTMTVTLLLKQQHLSKHPLDDEISQRCLKSFLKMLDPMKVYFYQSDIDEFSKSAQQLDDMARKGDVSFGYKVFQTFLTRVDERMALVEKALAMKHDFTVDEELVIDRDAAQYPKTPEEAWDRWRKRIKYDLLVLKTEEEVLEGDKAVEKLGRRYRSFAKRMHQTDSEDLLEMYLTSLTSAYDPHTSYMSPETYENFGIQMSLKLDGIGAELQSEDGTTIVRRVVPGGAADKDGRLKEKDKIVGVGEGANGEFVDVVDMKLSDVVKHIRGVAGTLVRLQVIDGGTATQKIVDITRAKIELKDEEAQGEVFELGQKPDGKPYKLGVIALPSFYMDMEGARRGLNDFKSTTRDVRKLLDKFTAEGVDAVVLDLRLNGGGSLTEAIRLTGLFIDEGPVVQVKDPDGNVSTYPDTEPGAAWSGPLVVLTSKLSASASEILAGAIQDYGRGLIVGDRATHGKGTVQSLIDLASKLFGFGQIGALKITMQQFYRPNGDSTQNRGVLADVELPSLTSHWDVGESDLDYPVAFDKVDPANFHRLGLVSKPICDRLSDLSAQRREDSDDFKKVARNIQRYQEQKTRKSVTLNEKKFLEERAELNADKEEQKKIEEITNRNRKAIDRDYYLNEALAITLDYIQLMHVAQAN